MPMLHLAQVHKQGLLGKADLQLLAYQKTETTWAMITDEEIISYPDDPSVHEGQLVLVELSSNRQVASLRDAKDWVLAFVQDYLTTGMTPEFLKGEAERTEEWRQTLTLQSQELARKSLEVEARREQIQGLEENLRELEEKLKREKKQLEQSKAELQGTQDSSGE